MWVWIALRTCVSTFCWKMVGPTALFTDPQKSSKYKFQYKFGSHGTIYIFKNYCATVFSVFSNKRYPNIPRVCIYSLLLSKIENWGKYILEAGFERNWFQEPRYSCFFPFLWFDGYNRGGWFELVYLHWKHRGYQLNYKPFYKGTLNICQIHFIC